MHASRVAVNEEVDLTGLVHKRDIQQNTRAITYRLVFYKHQTLYTFCWIQLFQATHLIFFLSISPFLFFLPDGLQLNDFA